MLGSLAYSIHFTLHDSLGPLCSQISQSLSLAKSNWACFTRILMTVCSTHQGEERSKKEKLELNDVLSKELNDWVRGQDPPTCEPGYGHTSTTSKRGQWLKVKATAAWGFYPNVSDNVFVLQKGGPKQFDSPSKAKTPDGQSYKEIRPSKSPGKGD
jgi:hypothetical protein